MSHTLRSLNFGDSLTLEDQGNAFPSHLDTRDNLASSYEKLQYEVSASIQQEYQAYPHDLEKLKALSPSLYIHKNGYLGHDCVEKEDSPHGEKEITRFIPLLDTKLGEKLVAQAILQLKQAYENVLRILHISKPKMNIQAVNSNFPSLYDQQKYYDHWLHILKRPQLLLSLQNINPEILHVLLRNGEKIVFCTDEEIIQALQQDDPIEAFLHLMLHTKKSAAA